MIKVRSWFYGLGLFFTMVVVKEYYSPYFSTGQLSTDEQPFVDDNGDAIRQNLDSPIGGQPASLIDSQNIRTPASANNSAVPDSVQSLRQCIAQKNGTLWRELTGIVTNCLAKHTSVRKETRFLGFHMGRLNEIKYFLPFVDQPLKSTDCVYLTVGVGGEYQAEKEFKEMYPDCRVFGIEPQSDQVPGFATYGTVIPKGVGTEAGELTMRVRVGSGKKAGYIFRKVAIEPLGKLLDEYVRSRLVHFSTMDIEGFEYHLIASLQKEEKFDSEGIVFCQIDAELHDEKMATKFSKTRNGFESFFTDMLLKSAYVPVKASGFLSHKKITFINIENPICEKLFAFRKYFMPNGG